MVIRSLCLSFAVLLSGCGATSPSPSDATPAAAVPAEAPPTAAASNSAAPAPAVSSPPAVDEAPKPPAASPSRKAVLVDQPKGTPLAVIEVTDRPAAGCGDKPTEGSTILELSLYWKPGTYVIGTRTKTASVRFRRFEGGKWKTSPDVVKGEIQVLEAPLEPGKSGRIHLRGDRAGQPIDDDVDVVLCVPFDPSKAK